MSDIDWPAGFDRHDPTERETNRSFGTSIAQTSEEIANEMRLLDVDTWRAETGSGGSHTKSNGLPKHSASPDDPGFVLRWSKDEADYAVACDSSPRLRDNMRYCYLWVNETRMRSQRPVETGESEFATARLPSGNEDAVEAREPPHEVLDVPPDADDGEVKKAWRLRAKVAHPDNGGSEERMKRLTEAKEAMIHD